MGGAVRAGMWTRKGADCVRRSRALRTQGFLGAEYA